MRTPLLHSRLALYLGAACFAAVPAATGTPRLQEEDEVVIEAQDLRAGDEEHQRYFLIGREGAEAPKRGFKLLLVLPGGDGSAEFLPFVERFQQYALGEDYLIAQLVAPVWSEDQAKSLVWPLEKNPHPKMEFTTEEFMAAVIADVESRRPIDPAYVFALGWSSSGPAVYAYSVLPQSRLTGAFVAMSVFKPGQMKSLKGAKGKAYFLLHSPEDFISMDFPELAQEKLKRSKAKVELVTYPGGHGWHGDVWSNVRRGIRFLEENHGKPKKRK